MAPLTASSSRICERASSGTRSSQLDELIHHYTRSTRELRKFCVLLRFVDEHDV